MNTMRVLHVLKSNSFSGAENVAITICKNMQNNVCAYTSPEGKIQETLQEHNVIYYPMKKFCLMELKRIVTEFTPDIIHAHDFSASVLASIVGDNKTAIISHLHNNVPWIKKWNIRSLAYSLALRKINSVILVSESIKREAIFAPQLNEKCKILGNPIDKETIKKRAEEQVNEKFDVLFVGRLATPKNPIKFINIIGQLVKKMPDLKAGMIGNGKLYEECMGRIERLHLENNICMKGFCKNPYPYMKQAKVVLVTSDWEGFGLVAREALVLRTPILMTDVGGMHELALNYPEIKCDKEEEFVYKTQKILSGAGSRRQIYESIYKEQGGKNNLQDYLKSLESLYMECLGNDV